MSQNTFSANMCVSVFVKCLYLVCLLFILASTKGSVDAKIISSPATEFSRHRIVQPTLHHGRTKREISTTRDTRGTHHSDVTVRVQIDGEEYVLDLRLNEDLITDNHVIQYQKGGKTVQHKPTKEEVDLCQYHGKVRGRPESRVAVSTCRGLRGVIHDGETIRYIQPVAGNDIQADHYLYDHADLQTAHRCGYEDVTKNASYDPELMKEYREKKSMERSRASRYKREIDDTQVRGPYNSNKLSRYLELVLVSDYREYLANDQSMETVYHQLKDVANIINSIYAPLNIFIALVGVMVWSERDMIQLLEEGDETLTNFLRYRREVLLNEIPNDNAQLITGQRFFEGVVGKALKGPICTFNYSGGVATNHSEVIGLVATTIAHEMGHNFGMEHDTEQDCQCPDDKCIMSPSSTSVMPTRWSSCSLKSLALAFERGMDYCLRNKPKLLFEPSTCGNGFVEPGEQCDCGMSYSGEARACHACCVADTCMLRANATCATGECCDLQTCRPMSAGTLCRAAERECDLPEYCRGHSEYCPADVFKMDSTPCGNDQAYCVRGSCRSHTDQCRLLWGTTGANSHDSCYDKNELGTKNGNCGLLRMRTPQYYLKCLKQDVKCGMLQCRHLNERLEFGMESVSLLSALFINNNGTIIPCRTAIIDLGISDVDPGLVPDGAKCGENKMCMSQKCVSVESVRAALAARESSVCPSNCSGHGVCNSEGHCHCDAGFAPPLCMLPGPGGSEDSGPAKDPSIQRNFMVAMYVIFLGIIPAILLGLFVVYYTRRDVLFWWKKPRKSYVHSLFCAGGAYPTKGWEGCRSSFSNASTRIRSIFTKTNKDTLKDTNDNIKPLKTISRNDRGMYPNNSSSLHNLLDNKCEITKSIDSKYVIKVNPTVQFDTIKNTDSKSMKPTVYSNEKLNLSKGKPNNYNVLKNKEVVKKFDRKIKKEDIKIASDLDVKVFKPPVKPKPVNDSKPNVTIVNKGLTSTTNELLNSKMFMKNRTRLNSVKKDGK